MLMKTEWLGYRMVKNYGNMLSRFHLIPERHGRTDGRTDRIPISISRVSMLTRDKILVNFLVHLCRFGSALVSINVCVTVRLVRLVPAWVTVL